MYLKREGMLDLHEGTRVRDTGTKGSCNMYRGIENKNPPLKVRKPEIGLGGFYCFEISISEKVEGGFYCFEISQKKVGGGYCFEIQNSRKKVGF